MPPVRPVRAKSFRRCPRLPALQQQPFHTTSTHLAVGAWQRLQRSRKGRPSLAISLAQEASAFEQHLHVLSGIFGTAVRSLAHRRTQSARRSASNGREPLFRGAWPIKFAVGWDTPCRVAIGAAVTASRANSCRIWLDAGVARRAAYLLICFMHDWNARCCQRVKIHRTPMCETQRRASLGCTSETCDVAADGSDHERPPVKYGRHRPIVCPNNLVSAR